MGSNYDTTSEEDRISNLPSCLIVHILSLLPTKDAVATSVLSTQWKYQWTLITCLEFDDEIVLMHPDKNNVAARQNNFINFVYHVLKQCKSFSLRRFRVTCSKSYDAAHVIAWVSSILRCKVQDLDISIPVDQSSFTLPWNLFNCGTLVELKLGKMSSVRLPSTSVVCRLPCLKVLCLDSVKLLGEDSVSRLIGCCPVLEELSLSRCVGKDVKVINISSPVLLRLNLTSLSYHWGSEVSAIKVVLETPKLLYLLIHDYVAQGYDFKDVHCLTKASLDMRFEKDVDGIYCESLCGLLEGISKVSSLEFGRHTLEAIISLECQLPEFQNALELKLGYSSVDNTRKLVAVLLKNIPFLTTLTFTEGLGYEGNYIKKWLPSVPPKDLPDCLLLCLKKIEIMNFRGRDNERAIVEYFLKYAKVLENLIIHYDITKIARASSICKVELL